MVKLPQNKRGKNYKGKQISKKVQKIQRKIFMQAKLDPDLKFNNLYSHIHLGTILKAAYFHSKENGGSAGVDRQSFKAIERSGRDHFIDTLQDELKKGIYKPKPVKRAWVKKSATEKRPLGIPTIKDRVAQTACKMILEPIFEADFDRSSYGYRPKRSARAALKEIKRLLEQGKTMIYKADLSKYFDTIPHGKLMIAVKKRIKDPEVIKLLKLWLQVPVLEAPGVYSGGKKHKLGTPQGGVISPLLSNIYLDLLDRKVNAPNGKYARAGVKMIRYADDFILIGEKIEERLLADLHKKIKQLDLIINKQKSRLINTKSRAFGFLGFTINRERAPYGERKLIWNIGPTPKAYEKILRDIDKTMRGLAFSSPEELAMALDPVLRSWLNYYKLGKSPDCRVPFIRFFDFLEQRLLRYYQKKGIGKMIGYEPGASIKYARQTFDILAYELDF